MEKIPEAHPAAVAWPIRFWRVLRRLDRNKLNSPGMALRNSLAVAIPLGVAIASGHPLAGVAVATGALNVAYSDGHDPYAHRARRMLAWSVLGALAVFLGSVTGKYHLLAILVASGWALAAGLLVSISVRAGDLGLSSLVTLIVYAARGAMSPAGALDAGLLVLGGGLLQTVFALLSWPLKRYAPERRALGRVYLDLSRQLHAKSGDVLGAPLTSPSVEVQDTLSALGRDHSLEGERFRLLFDQADRLRFSFYVVSRLEAGLVHEQRAAGQATADAVDDLRQLLELSCNLLSGIGESLLLDRPFRGQAELIEKLSRVVHAAQGAKTSSGHFAQEFAGAADLLAGQLRVVAQLAENTTTEGAEQFAQREFAPPLKLQLRSWLATLQANLDLSSPAFRHGIRLAVCVALGDAFGRTINTQRSYWLAMTVAVVLKPDFTTTISRGVLRLAGTFAGLVLATALFHALPPSAITQLFLVGIFTFALRYVGPANYGIFSLAISGLIVFLIAETGVPPAQVIWERAVNTAAGGMLALVAYAVWPTWERSQVADAMAEMIDRLRDYFHAVTRRFSETGAAMQADLDEARSKWRQARSSAEASVDRLASEPGTIRAQLDALTSMLASSHSLVRSTMGLEAGFDQFTAAAAPPALKDFCRDVEFTLYYLSAALRGSHFAAQTIPQLREDHRRLVESRFESRAVDTYVVDETDRLTVSLNTLREQVMRYVSTTLPRVTEPAYTTMK